jgi:broad specificity phosphatase PhoE
MTQLVLLRHGQTDWNLQGRWQGQADPPLNAAGRVQVLRAAWALRQYRFDAIYSSNLQRALQTAEILAIGRMQPVAADARLREICLGSWQGMFSREIEAQYPEEFRLWHTSPLAMRPPQGEHVSELALRVTDAITQFTRQHPEGRIAVVGHELPLAVVACQALRIDLRRVRDFILPNGGWREVTIDGRVA